MLHALRFVKGAVAKKDFQPALTHFLIKNNRILGYNGTIALSSPIDLDIHAAPRAVPFWKAIERCEQETSINLTETGRLTLRSGSFRATVPCTDELQVLSEIQPEGRLGFIVPDILEAIKVLGPLIGTDASRPWGTGLALKNYSAYATNNIIIGQYWLGAPMPNIIIPSSAIAELDRIGKEPEDIQISPTSATFHFDDGRWMRTQLLDGEWPNVDPMLDAAFENTDVKTIPPELFESLEKLKPFLHEDGRVYFRDSMMATMIEGEIGASVDIDGLPNHGCYNHHMLSLLTKIHKIDFTTHPRPSPFIGDNLRGVILGMREKTSDE